MLNPQPSIRVPSRSRAMTGLSLQTNRIARRPQVLPSMVTPQAQPPIGPRKKGRGNCFAGVLQRLMKSDFSDEEKKQARTFLARLFPRRGNRYYFGKQYI